MNNVIKMLATNKDYRIVIADTCQIAADQLRDFTGSDSIRAWLEQVMTSCTLFAAMTDINRKTSFSFRFAKDISIYCRIANAKLSVEYSEQLHAFTGSLTELLHPRSVLSITSGDWETGLHTGTVEAHIDNISLLLSHFTAQSEQLPTHFILADHCSTRGLAMQPLPFADSQAMAKYNAELVYLTKRLAEADWCEVPGIYTPMASVVSENQLE